MSITKYSASFGSIDKIEVEKETDASVWYRTNNGALRRAAKRSSYESIFDTWAEAHAFLIDKAEAALIEARRSLQRAQDKYSNVKGMKPPQELA
jgi:hypothetical protein